jgi:GNAT superfamily N-acetyltransferase
MTRRVSALEDDGILVDAILVDAILMDAALMDAFLMSGVCACLLDPGAAAPGALGWFPEAQDPRLRTGRGLDDLCSCASLAIRQSCGMPAPGSRPTSAPMIIRAALPSDRVHWRALWDGYNEFYGRAGATALPAEITEALWARIFDPAEPVHARLAELDGSVVGLAHYLFHRSTTMLAPICYLQDLFVDDAARGRGAGRTLIETVYREASAAGSSRVYWQTHETNMVARALYDTVAERSGFIVYRKAL